MSKLPFLRQFATPGASVEDNAVLEDASPAVLDRDSSGCVFARTTKITEVQLESTDDV
jgi:hypothetical protein